MPVMELSRIRTVDTLRLYAMLIKPVTPECKNVLSRDMPEITEDEWMEAIDAVVKPAFVELNKRAFRMGREA